MVLSGWQYVRLLHANALERGMRRNTFLSASDLENGEAPHLNPSSGKNLKALCPRSIPPSKIRFCSSIRLA
jgi:hypothetical protein